MLLSGWILHVGCLDFFSFKKSTWTTTCAQFLHGWEPETEIPGLSYLCRFPDSLKWSCELKIPEWDISVVGSPWNQVLWKHGFSISPPNGPAENITEQHFVNRTSSKLSNYYKTFLVLISQIGKVLIRGSSDLSVTSAQSIMFNLHGQDLDVFWVLDILLSGFCFFCVLSPTSHILLPC